MANKGISSSFCGDAGCIYVDLQAATVSLSGGVYDAETDSMVWPISDWAPFVAGIKAGEFDHNASAMVVHAQHEATYRSDS